MKITKLTLLFWFMVQAVIAQQVPDTVYASNLNLQKSEYKTGNGPLILIDGGHNNFHRAYGNFAPLRILLEKDGYQVKSLDQAISETNLKDCHILVVSNALAANNVGRWYMPVYSAFTDDEVETIKNWVQKGGSLLLIADHMPFAGAANNLAHVFGFDYVNGFADNCSDCWPPSFFYANNNSLSSLIANGRNRLEKVDSVAAFTGSAFSYPEQAQPVLLFSNKDTIMITDTAWQINEKTTRQVLTGKAMGAVMKSGKGRVAIFGEAAMFTAQLTRNNDAVGFNTPEAPQNIQFILNLFHWLEGKYK